MNKKTWLIIAIVSAIWVCLFPLIVFGETGTYTTINNIDECFLLYNRSDNNRGYYVKINNNTSEVRFTAYINNNGDGSQSVVWGFVSENKFRYYAPTNNGCASSTQSTHTVKYNGVNYIYAGSIMSQWAVTAVTFPIFTTIPTFNIIGTNDDKFRKLVDLTFGEGSQEPVEPVVWGLLRDTSYTTRIAGSGQAARQNIDVITWEKSIDTNGNDISECEVEIQAVYGKFTGNSLVNLWEKDLQDFSIYESVSLAVIPASYGNYSIGWQTVVENLNNFDFDLIWAHEVNQQIEKNGWYYQIRMIRPDDTIGEWQTLYTPLSMGAKASETIITNNSFDMSVYQVYQDLSTINNNTSITITYIDTDYTINNPSDGTEPEGGTNLWDVLKELISGIFQILAKLGDLVGNLIDGLMGIFQNLFTPSEVDQEINNNINVEVNTYLEESQPGLNQIHNNIDTWKLQLEDIAREYADGGDCIIAWADVSIDLSAFNAGTVTFIPGGQYDLKTAFISLLTAFGISYSTYEMIVSAIIYISLIVLISHKVKGFLKT